MSMDGPPKDNKESIYNQELRKDLDLTLNGYRINPKGKEEIISAFIDKKSGRLIFTLGQNIETVDVDASKDQHTLTEEIFDILDKYKEMMLPEELLQQDKVPDQIIVTFKTLQ
jgi:hypothetical protein